MTAPSERGMTLVELLVAITVLGLISGVLGTTLYLGLRTTRDNETRLNQSNGAQILTTWLTKDVQKADAVTVDDPSATCGGPARLKLVSPSNALRTAPDTVTAYAIVGGDLVRRVCTAGAPTPAEHAVAFGVLGFDAVCTTSTCTATVVAAASTSNPDITTYEYTIEVRRRLA